MESLFAILIGTLFAAGIFCLLRRSLLKLIIGIMLLSQGANLLVFTSAGLTSGQPAFVRDGTSLVPHADPIPQALVLTAIVIGFGLVAFSISLLLKAYHTVGSDDTNTFNQTDRIS